MNGFKQQGRHLCLAVSAREPLFNQPFSGSVKVEIGDPVKTIVFPHLKPKMKHHYAMIDDHPARCNWVTMPYDIETTLALRGSATTSTNTYPESTPLCNSGESLRVFKINKERNTGQAKPRARNTMTMSFLWND